MRSVADLVAERAAVCEMARRDRMARAWRAYYGEMPRPLRVRPGDPDDNILLNFPRLVVDKGVSALFGAEPGLAVGGDARGERAQAWLDRVWEANRKGALLHAIGVNGAVCGHAFVRIRPGAAGAGLPRLVNLDPQTVSVFHEADDYEAVTAYRLEWHGMDPRSGRPCAFRETIERRRGGPAPWSVRTEASEGDGPWRTASEAAWPFAWPPIAGCQNLPAPNEVWGVGDLEGDVLAVCSAINFTLSNMARILRFHAHPKTWGSGFSARQLDVAVDGLTILPSPDARLQNLEMQSDLGSSLQMYGRLKEALHEIARIPEVAMGRLEGLGALSGTALRILYEPLVEKTRTKRLLYGELLEDLGRRLLEMGGFGAGARVEVAWPPLGPPGGRDASGSPREEVAG